MIPQITAPSVTHRLACLDLVDEIIEGMDERALNEMMSGDIHDVDTIFDALMEDTYRIMYTGDVSIDFKPRYEENVSAVVEDTLRCANLTYFITSVIPDFQLSWHHLEWGELVHNHKKLCINAARDHGKCEAVGTPVRMYDGTIKKVEDVAVGDLLMGIDSKPRRVVATRRGHDSMMYRIDQSRGDSYIVNSRHICTLIEKDRNGSIATASKRIVDIDIPTLLSKTPNRVKERYRGFKVAVQYPARPVEIEPYSFGYNARSNSRIPEQYLVNSEEVRLQVLAGLIDSDGNYWQGGYHFSNTNYQLVCDVKNLADSLGFCTRMGGGTRYCKALGRDYSSWCVTISGELDRIPVKIARKKVQTDWSAKTSHKDWGTIDGVHPTVVSSLKITSVGEGDYISITTDGDHRFVLGDGTVTHNSFYFSNAYAAWQLYRYKKPSTTRYSKRPTAASSNRGFLFSFSLQQSVDLLEILKGTIEENEILKERLFPQSTANNWSATNIVCRNGARLTGKGFGSSVRGAHPYWIIVDDGLKDNVIYSSLQRNKSTDYFHSVIMNMLVPGGQIIVVGTPFHAEDLYGDLKTKNGWFVIEYPAIFPDGRILWPQRWSFKDLMDKKETQGSIIFSRENLCRPITNESSIFPMEILTRSLLRMENYTLVDSREEFPIKFSKVVVGCDFAISANVGADYAVFSVWGIDELTDERWLLHLYREKGVKFFEQMNVLRRINSRFRPDLIVMENNTFQQIFVETADTEGMPVIGHTTGIDKYDLKTGWPHLSTLFERGKIHIPIGNVYSQQVKDLIFQDLGSVAFTEKGLESVGSHDDISSSFWLADLAASRMTTGFKFDMLG
nr:MAG TPA: Terminase large subunit [Bacteriophage sp.]